MTRRETGTYLYVKEGARPRQAPVRLDRPHLPPPTEPPRPETEGAVVRLLRPDIAADAIDPRFAMFLMPDTEVAGIYRQIADTLQAAGPDGGRIVVAAPDRTVARTRTLLNVAAALVEPGGFASVVGLDAGAGSLAPTLGISAWPGLRGQAEGRERDPRRPVDVLHVAWRVGALPLEPDGRLPTPSALEAALTALDAASKWVFLDAAPWTEAPPTLAAGAADALIVVLSPAQAAAGLTLPDALAPLTLLGVIVDVALG
ncbi:MAG: hypothetical protein R3F60_05660 [bacterium]